MVVALSGRRGHVSIPSRFASWSVHRFHLRANSLEAESLADCHDSLGTTEAASAVLPGEPCLLTNCTISINSAE